MGFTGGANFGRFEQTAKTIGRGNKFVAVVGANDTLTGRKRKRLQNARIGDSEQRRFGRRMNRDASKPRCWQVHITKYFAHSQLASAGFHGRGMVVVNYQAAVYISSSNGGPADPRDRSFSPQAGAR